MLRVYPHSKNYTASVVLIKNLNRVQGLDNLLVTNIFGNNVLVSKDVEVGTIGLYFPVESQLSPAFLSANNLYRDKELNRDKSKTGFFEPHGRVKAIKFRGIPSAGFWIPINSINNVLENTSDELKVGDEFNEIGGIEICRKYIPQTSVEISTTAKAGSKKQRKLARFDRLIPNQFRFHEDTLHFAKNINKFKLDDIITITSKMHGTSFVLSHVLVNKPLKFHEKLLKRFGVPIKDTDYDILYSSRSVLRNRYINKNCNDGYYKYDIWQDIWQNLRLFVEPGISVYGEAVGFLPCGKYIQSKFDYGCEPKSYKCFIYRITYTSVSGHTFEFSWNQIKDYCIARGISHVPELYYGTVLDCLGIQDSLFTWEDRFLQHLRDRYLERDCSICVNKVPSEGIVIRKDALSTYEAYKLKSFRFLQHETKVLDSGESTIGDNE